MELKTFTMPADNCLWFDDDQRCAPARPSSSQPNPDQSILFLNLETLLGSLQDCQLLTQGKILKGQLAPLLKH